MLRSTNLRRFAAGVAILGLMAGFSIPAAANVVIDGNLADFPTLNPDVCGTNATGDNIHQQGEKADDTNWALPAIQSPNTGDDFCGIGATTEIHGNDVFAVAGFQLYTCEPAATVVSFEMNSSTARTATNQPIRTVGDLWIDVIVNTPDPLAVHVYSWSGTEWTAIPTPPGVIQAEFATATCSGEISVNLSAIGVAPDSCAKDFAQSTAHTRSSESFNSSLKDYAGPFAVVGDLCKIHVEKVPNPAAGPVGTVVTYTFTVTNPGHLPLVGVTLSDPKCDSLFTPFNTGADATPTSLDPGDTWTSSCTRTILASDPDPLPNTVTVTGYDAHQNSVTDTANASVDILHPGISVSKTVTGGSPYDTVGDVISYDVVVANIGEIPLTNVAVTDPGADAGSIDCNGGSAGLGNPIGSIGVGGSVTCTATHTVTQVDLDAGHYNNCAGASSDQQVSAESCANTTGEQHPAIHLQKNVASVTPSGAIVTGSVVHYALTITNTGNVTLTNVTLTDPGANPGSIDCNGAAAGTGLPLPSLAPSASQDCTATHTVTQDDVDNGNYTNTATTVGTPPSGPNVSDDDTASVDIPMNASILLDKSEKSSGPYAVGEQIAYELVATNNGNVTLKNVTVTDNNADSTPDCNGALAGTGQPIPTLPVGASVTCTAVHTVTQPDVDAGNVHNVAIATGTPPKGGNVTDTDEVDVPIAQNPSINLNKALDSITPSGAIVVGSVIHYDLTITNDGNVTLTNVTLTDPGADPGSIDCSGAAAGTGLPLPSLAPGASKACTGNHTVTQSDVDHGSYYNVATTSGNPPHGDPVTDTDDELVKVPTNPAIDITKTVSNEGPYLVGEVIAYDLLVKNTGNVTLSDVTVTDPTADATPDCNGDAAGTGQPIPTLAPNATRTCTVEHTVTQDDVDAGHYANVATAKGNPPGEEDPVDDSDTEDVPLPSNPLINLVKQIDSVSPTGPIAAGSVLTYSLKITNTGNVTLTNVTLTDPGADAGSIDCNGSTAGTGLPLPTLAPLASRTCSARHTVTQADVETGMYTNVATTTGTPPTGDPVSDDDTAVVTVPQNPAIGMSKTVTSSNNQYVLGDTVTYKLVAKNTGNVTLKNVSVSDPKADATPDCNGSADGTGQPVATLKPGDSVTCTASHVVTAADVTAGAVVNVATTKGTPPKGDDVTSNDTATVPVIEVKSEVAVPTTTTTTTSAAPSTSVKGTVALPVTGAEIAEFGVVGLGILGSGYGMVLGARRRRRNGAGNSSE